MQDRPLPIRRIVFVTIAIVLIALVAIFLLEDQDAAFTYPTN